MFSPNKGTNKNRQIWAGMDMLTQWGTVLSPYFYVTDHYVVYAKYLITSFVNYTSINLGDVYRKKKNKEYGRETACGPPSQKY